MMGSGKGDVVLTGIANQPKILVRDIDNTSLCVWNRRVQQVRVDSLVAAASLSMQLQMTGKRMQLVGCNQGATIETQLEGTAERPQLKLLLGLASGLAT